MKKRVCILLVMLMAALDPFPAAALTLLQENLIDVPNRFAVSITDFATDGELTPNAVRGMVERQLRDAGLKLVAEDSAPPLATVQITIMGRGDAAEGKVYLLDVNVYNVSVINTTYRLRKGTIWMVGSEKVIAGSDFPKDVEGKLSQMLRYLVQDYFAANPNEGGKQ